MYGPNVHGSHEHEMCCSQKKAFRYVSSSSRAEGRSMLGVEIAILLSHSSVDMKALASQESMAEVVSQCRPLGNRTWHLPDRTEYIDD